MCFPSSSSLACLLPLLTLIFFSLFLVHQVSFSFFLLTLFFPSSSCFFYYIFRLPNAIIILVLTSSSTSFQPAFSLHLLCLSIHLLTPHAPSFPFLHILSTSLPPHYFLSPLSFLVRVSPILFPLFPFPLCWYIHPKQTIKEQDWSVIGMRR